MAKSGIVSKSYKSGNFTQALSWELVSQDVNNNSSVIKWEWSVTTVDASQGSSNQIVWLDAEIVINGATVYSGSSSISNITNNTKYVLQSGTQTINHNLDGTKTFSYSASYQFISPFTSQSSMSGTGELDAIARNGKMVDAPNFTDEDSPTITYICPAGSSATSLQAAISFTGGNDDIAYRDIPKGSGGSTQLTYTFTLTTADKNALWAKLNEGSYTTTVRFYIKTVINGNTFWDYITRTLTFVNYKPVITPLVYDTNADTIALTGNKNKLIRYMSNAYYNIQAVARKGATISNQVARNGSLTLTGATGTFNNVTSNSFNFTVTDSRGDTTTDFTVFSIQNGYFIEYVKLTCDVSTDQMTAEGNINVTVTGKYYEGTLGATNNTLTLRYSLNKENTEDVWYDLGTVTPTVDDDNNYSYTFQITGLDYLSIYKLTVCAKDKVMHEESVATWTIAATPIFDWSQDDFRFYVPVQMDGGFSYPHKILWGDATNPYSQLGATDTITLKERISEQSTGIVLIFSLFRDGAVEDVSIQSFFIPRAQVQYLFSNCPQMFMMGINSNLSIFGSKYVYISDSTLRGFSGNTASGTAASGITFDNSSFVLRYVLGV